MKVLTRLGLCSVLAIAIGCSKDKNMDDYRRDQLQQSIERISSASGSYSGAIISKLDRSNLGSVKLQFSANTSVSSSNSQVSNEQNSTVSGTLDIAGLTQATITFDNGFYDDVTGNFQVTIPVTLDGGTISKISLNGKVADDRWLGSIEVANQTNFGGILDLKKNAPMPNTSAMEVSGVRLQQMKRTDYTYTSSYKDKEGTSYPLIMSFINRDISPEQNVYKIFSPIRYVNLNLDFSGFELNFHNALLDDKANTLVGRDPVDQRGNLSNATLNCLKSDDDNNLGWDCDLQTKAQFLHIHLNAKK
jgi:hypothetical protein